MDHLVQQGIVNLQAVIHETCMVNPFVETKMHSRSPMIWSVCIV